MNHAVTLDLSAAEAKYELFRRAHPQKRLPAAFAFDRTAPVLVNLNNLALFALHHKTTTAVLLAYKPIFIELAARWVDNPEEFESAFQKAHNAPAVELPGTHVLLALSRVIALFPESFTLITKFLHASQIISRFSDRMASLPEEESHLVLLAIHRIYSARPQAFSQFVDSQTFYNILTLPESYAISKYLAVEILAQKLEASEATTSKMKANHVNLTLLVGAYDAEFTIDYSFLELVEAKRLSNSTQSTPADLPSGSSRMVTIQPEDLSSSVFSVCGTLIVSNRSKPPAPVEEVVPTANATAVLTTLVQKIHKNIPVMLHGAAGSGKTFLINQLARYFDTQKDIVKIHLGELTDAKLLLGTYTSGKTPGSFEWRSGVLTSAVKSGKWVLVEDIDKAPTEVLSILLTLLEKRELSIPSRGEILRAHVDFKLIATVRTQGDSQTVPDMIGLRLWDLVEVTKPTAMELRLILALRFPLLRNLIPRFIEMYDKVCHIYSMSSFISLNKGSHPRIISVRDLMKFCSRCNRMLSNKGITDPDQLLETQVFDNIFAEAVECFGSAVTEFTALHPLVQAIGEVLEMPSSRTNMFLENHAPSFYADEHKIEVGRALLHKSETNILKLRSRPQQSTFARTKHSKRLMEQVGVGIEMAEPILLVGETGTGKTTVVQEIAKMMHKNLTVINVSQQTESGDLLGGYKPVNTKTIAIPIQETFENLFLATFSLKKNARFSSLLTKCFNKSQWKNVIRLWKEATKMADNTFKQADDSEEDLTEGAPKKKRKVRNEKSMLLLQKWKEFQIEVETFESQAARLDNSFVFSFVEGSLIKAVKNGDWLLLDEINLASADTLESIADLLTEDPSGRSVLLSERGDVDGIIAHPDFRIFGCMNPSTDVGKRDLPVSIRSRFTEIYVHSPDKDRDDLVAIIEKYIDRYSVGDDWAVEDIAELYYHAKKLSDDNKIVDGANQKPHFSIRTLTRTLIYVCEIVDIYGLRRALYEGFSMAFLTLLDRASESILKPIIAKYTIDKLANGKHLLTRCPPPPSSNADEFVQFKHYWIRKGPKEPETPNYIITPFVEKNLLNLVRASASRKFPVLVQGPTSAGKTSMINYLASITGHQFVRINNHEHTDLQEYLGAYVSDATGKLVFREGILVEALRKGHWIVLDELNLAPTDVLEALNRLLDDNRELFIPETQETIHPHPDFMLFATQNPPGLYGGRKVLSRAFRNRFLELHFDDIPQDELEIILKERCQIAPSYCKKIVEVYRQLSNRRQSTRLFEQKNSFATLRDLFRWAMRDAVGYEELAANGYMLLAERVRTGAEKNVVQETIEKVMKVKLDMQSYYEKLENATLLNSNSSVVWTRGMRRLAVLVETSIKYKEPLLLVGETGCGKTTVCQILAEMLGKRLITVNAHQNTETGDILGAQRPLRNRYENRADLVLSLVLFLESEGVPVPLHDVGAEKLIEIYTRHKASISSDDTDKVAMLDTLDEKVKNASMLFEWADGPLVQAMKSGDFFLLDEISLADDSVLERLNSVLEPERSLLLAEKGSENAFLTAEASFQFLATMNPGGDYGKKELSPALRNRFTEIWVPSMEDFDDVQEIVQSRLLPGLADFATPLVEYSRWFGERLGNGVVNNGVLSLRDILAWVEFMNSCYSRVSSCDSFVNGACMVFVDALGTNNTAFLAENEAKLNENKQECLIHLCSLISKKVSDFFSIDKNQIVLTKDVLRAGEFEIPRVNSTGTLQDFHLETPTTSANAKRVVRAMQVTKPILLEGSPGVGKTSLISAISKVTGNHLIRINLSEQTDLIDLFGSDTPVENGSSGEFVWRDAPFLRAMKIGEWVLLDEMNLASQSVLEGLNACLDHRGEAYIPELDKSFPRHPKFRVFAAQNPQYQGGGRKGLPKSFVNRFSVVYMDTLKEEDLKKISQKMFPQISTDECSQMIEFMSKLEQEVVVQKQWGMSGGPWEFNLRDSLRWLSLYSSSFNLDPQVSLSDFLGMIIRDRFRIKEDRDNVEVLFNSIFGSRYEKDAYFSLGQTYIQAGGALMIRNDLVQRSYASDRVRFLTLQCNNTVLETAIRSVNQKIPLILTGPTNAGKTEFVRYFANLAGARLCEFSMNSDVDSMDILGGYEQEDFARLANELFYSVTELLQELLLQNVQSMESDSETISRCLSVLEHSQSGFTDHSGFVNFLQDFKLFVSRYTDEKLVDLITRAEELNVRLQEPAAVKFTWFDGLLVRAVTNGDWLILDNANLCNPSVLDRLNSLLETNGSLIINECSQEDGLPRVLRPHPNFRLFLTVDPKYGELSRAMRNRCIEIFMPDLDVRASEFDARCLGKNVQSVTGKLDSSIESDMSKLHVGQSLSQATPVSAFIASTHSEMIHYARLLDIISKSEHILAASLCGITSITMLHKQNSYLVSVNNSEFTLAEIAEILAVSKIIKKLTLSTYVEKLMTLYGRVDIDAISCAELPARQVLHPACNPYIMAYFSNAPDFELFGEAATLFLVAANQIQLNKALKKVEEKALSARPSDLTFLERSAAASLGRQLKKPPTINVFGFVDAVSRFVNDVFVAYLKQDACFYSSTEPSVLSALHELQSVLRSILEQGSKLNISQLRVFHTMISDWLERNEALPMVKDHSQTITALKVGLELTSGFSMSLIWKKFKQEYPKTESSWEMFLQYLELMSDFDVLCNSIHSVNYPEIGNIRKQMAEYHNAIIQGSITSDEMAAVLEQLQMAFTHLQKIAAGYQFEKDTLFVKVFTNLSNIVELEQFQNIFDADSSLELWNYTSKSTVHWVNGKKPSLLPYPRLFDSLWGKNSSIKALISDDFLEETLSTSSKVISCPGKFLDQRLRDLSILELKLIEHSPAVLADNAQTLKSMLFGWILQVVLAHGINVDAYATDEVSRGLEVVRRICQSVKDELSETIVGVFELFFLPALYLIVQSPKPVDLGKAWILFAGGCIQLFVPNSPMDPAIENEISAIVLSNHKNELISLAESWRSVMSVLSGDRFTNLERSLPEIPTQEGGQADVHRSGANVDILFEEWKAFLDSSIDAAPLQKLIEAAENLGDATNLQRIEIFQNNATSFIQRLEMGYPRYADLNDILVGYIYGIKLGADLLKIAHQNNLAQVEIPALWPLNIDVIMNSHSLAAIFASVKTINKSISNDSILSEKLMHFVVVLCFMQLQVGDEPDADFVLNQAFQSLYYRWFYRKMKLEEEQVQAQSLFKHKDTDDIDEEFRQLFPDFDDVMHVEQSKGVAMVNFDEVHHQISQSYVSHFLKKASVSAEEVVMEGASLFIESADVTIETKNEQNSASELAAILLWCENSKLRFSTTPDHLVDFHHGASPSQYHKAVELVSVVANALSKILEQWPEHATLQNITRVCNEFLEYSSSVSLDKLLHKIEVLHGFLNEWEKFASSTVSLKKYYDDVTQLIISWRRLELASWKSLLEFEDMNAKKQVGKWWFHLFETLVLPLQEDSTASEISVPQILNALKIFVSETSVGEYVARIELLKAFLSHIQKLSRGQSDLVKALNNFVTFYEQFIPKIQASVKETRQKLDKDIGEVILLASWKDVNIDALKQSSKRSHNELFKIVRKYRAFLRTQVIPIIEAGLPADSESTTYEVKPFKNVKSNERTQEWKLTNLTLCERVSTWADRPQRLKNLETVEKNLRIYCERISAKKTPSILAYANDTLAEMEQLRKETPKIYSEDTKKAVAASKLQKQKLLSEVFKELRRIGVRTTVKTDVRTSLATVNLIFSNSAAFCKNSSLSSLDAYFLRSLDLLPGLRHSIASGNDEVPTPDLERGLAASENLLFSLVTWRKPMLEFAENFVELENLVEDLASLGEIKDGSILKATLVPSLRWNLQKIHDHSAMLTKVLEYCVSVLDKLHAFNKSANIETFTSALSRSAQFTAAVSASDSLKFTSSDTEVVLRYNAFLNDTVESLSIWGQNNTTISFIASVVLSWLQRSRYSPFLSSSTSLTQLAEARDIELKLRKCSNTVLLSIQSILEQCNDISDEDDNWFTMSQQNLTKCVQLLHYKRIRETLADIRATVFMIEHNKESSAIISALLAFTIPIVKNYLELCATFLSRLQVNYHEVSKALFILMKTMSTLATDGFCSPSPPDEQKTDNNLQDGTGLGDGEGATNNSKDADEDDDDLAEHAQQPNDEKEENDEEQDDDAVDMKGDMAGELEETSDQEPDENKEEDSETEELDEEVDDIDDLDPNAIDEKMWDEKASEDTKEKDSEKMPQNAEQDDDNVEANENEEEHFKPEEKQKEEDNAENDDESGDDEDGDENEGEDVGEQEDEMRNEENEQLDEHVPETETLDLPENMDIDNEGSDGSDQESETEDPMDLDNADDDDSPANDDDAKETEPQTAEPAGSQSDADASDLDEEQDPADNVADEKNIEEEPIEETPNDELDEDIAGPDLEEQDGEEKEESEEDKQEAGAEGDEGADAQDNSDEMDIDSATKNEMGEQGEGADNVANDEQDNIGTSGATSTELKQEEDQPESHEEQSVQDEMKESLKQLGDSLKEFHRRRQEIKEAATQEKENPEDSANTKNDEFEHIEGENTEHDTQALGSADNKDQIQNIDENMAIDDETEEAENVHEENVVKKEEDEQLQDDDENDAANADAGEDYESSQQGGIVGERREIDNSKDDNLAHSMEVEETEAEKELEAQPQSDFLISNSDVPAMDLSVARDLWRSSEIATQELASGLSEQLRLILEPTLATKLRGDYKTGKRLNMKRIISYIASDFRKDKIWLRRTKPAKRQYQIMIAVDDSKSMTESKSTELAFHSIALVSKALTQLESGGLSIVRFGEDVKLVHEFDKPFNQGAGAEVFKWFDFKQERTDIKQLCSKSLKIFEDARATSNSDLWQLQIIISDGVCEDHATVQRLVRQARDEKVMLVFVVVDGLSSSGSILDMSQVSYVQDPLTGGMTLKVDNYLDSFPFEFYVVVRNINELPEMLSLILRQYFSEVANL